MTLGPAAHWCGQRIAKDGYIYLLLPPIVWEKREGEMSLTLLYHPQLPPTSTPSLIATSWKGGGRRNENVSITDLCVCNCCRCWREAAGFRTRNVKEAREETLWQSPGKRKMKTVIFWGTIRHEKRAWDKFDEVRLRDNGVCPGFSWGTVKN